MSARDLMEMRNCKNCKFFTERKFVKSDADTYGRWCDGYCSEDKQYTWFYNGCKKHEWKDGQHGFEERDKSAD